MALSKKTKKARQSANKLKNESPHSRKKRLIKNMRSRRSQYYSQFSTQDKKKLSQQESEKNRSSVVKRETVQERVNRLTRHRLHVSRKRDEENLVARSMRLTQMQQRASHRRQNEESPTSRDARLAQMREHASIMREQESPPSRDVRLAQMREHVTLVREQESPSSCDVRLAQMREHMSIMREQESPSSRDMRLTQMREHVSLVREQESPSSRGVRLAEIRQHVSLVREQESPSSRDARLTQMQEHAVMVRNDETPRSRQERFTAMQRNYRCRRQLINNDSNFEEKIRQVPENICYCCEKTLYQKQTRRISAAANTTVLPQNHPDVFICCNRCANIILKNKTPPTAFWNNMRVVPIPPELECLNEMEVRLISRVRPFIKVVRLGGRFGQQGFKGQATLFAQQVEELAEQLPISVSNAGLTIVAESLENVSGSRRYCVDINKIKKALEWLVINNHLYANIQLNTSLNSDEINQSILEAVSIPATQINHAPQRDSHQYFKCIGNDKSILRGHFHQGSDRFGSESRGRQCTANAAAAIASSALKLLPEWSPSDVDRVLLAGDRYFMQCMARLPQRPNYLNTEELLPCLTVGEIPVNLLIEPDVAVGLIRPTTPGAVPDNYFSSIVDGVQHFFSSFEVGIVTCETQYAVAIFKHGLYYYLFDSHSRGPKGFVAGEKGTSMVLKFPTVDSLCKHLLIVLEVRSARNLQFSITAVSPVENTTTPTAAESPAMSTPVIDDNCDKNDSVDILSNLFDGEIVTTSLMPIDTDLPTLDTVLTNANPDHPVPVCQLKRKTIPPISVLREQRAEELAWVKLFPNGKNGFREQRQVPITPLDYFQSRVMSKEKRFQVNEYLFFALSMVELYKAQQNVSVCGRLRQDGAEPTNVVQNVHLVMRNIRGTQSYWHKAFTDLMAMVRNLGAPHFYITLSCNDLHWPDILQALLLADGRPDFPVSQLSFQEKLRLVESYPVTLCRQFMLRLNTFFTHLRRQDDPILGHPIVDFWWRIEFQLRGSPHVHMVVWCTDMPSFDSEEGVSLLDQVVTCRLPSLNEDPELRGLVSRLQSHNHTHTCYKNNPNCCRFGFPRPIANQSRVLDEDEATRNGGRFYLLRREEAEKNINNYNIRMLRMWQANMDIQPCGTATGIAYYISKYISKSEPAEISKSIRDAIRRVQEKGGSMAKQVFAMQNAILTHWEVSACEAAVRLCHIKMRDSSRKVIFVNSCVPELRYRMMRLDDDTNEPYRNIFDRYVSRPHTLEALSLGEFAVCYEPVTRNYYSEDDQDADAYDEDPENNTRTILITLLDNLGKMKKRNRPAVLRTRYYTPNSDPEGYYYSLLVTHIPFRSETELLEGYNTAKEAFFVKKDLLRPIQEGHNALEMANWEQEIQQAISRVVAENLAK